MQANFTEGICMVWSCSHKTTCTTVAACWARSTGNMECLVLSELLNVIDFNDGTRASHDGGILFRWKLSFALCVMTQCASSWWKGECGHCIVSSSPCQQHQCFCVQQVVHSFVGVWYTNFNQKRSLYNKISEWAIQAEVAEEMLIYISSFMHTL